MNAPEYSIPEEAEKKALLDGLFEQWAMHLASCPEMEKYPPQSFIRDGFYPYYTRQALKILFIAREALGIEGSYIDSLYNAYRSNNIGGRSVGRYKFHRLLMKMAYGLIHDRPDWQDIPPASIINQDFAKETGISFAFMNVSKLNNSSANWQANWAMMHDFLAASRSCGRNLFNEEIGIIAPDLIVCMTGDVFLDCLGERTTVTETKEVNEYFLRVNGKEIPLLHTYHFSAPRKKENEAYYRPVREILRESFPGWNPKKQ